MRIVEPSVEIMTPIDGERIMRHIELCGRVCYKSEDRITGDSAERLVRSIIRRGHESVLEHYDITFRFICDRGVSHELVRHRMASYSQESSRYCNYGHTGEIAVIAPCSLSEGTVPYAVWEQACKQAEKAYMSLLACGCKPEIARSVLPTSLKTEVVCTMNLRELRHFLRLRTDKAAHPDMRLLATTLLAVLKRELPVVFEDINIEEDNKQENEQENK